MIDLGSGSQPLRFSDKGLTASAERQGFGLSPSGFRLLTPLFLGRRERELVHDGSPPEKAGSNGKFKGGNRKPSVRFQTKKLRKFLTLWITRE